MKKIILYIQNILLTILLVGCMEPKIQVQNDAVHIDSLVPINTSPYIVGPGDVLDATYYFEMAEDENEYVISVGDIVRIEFYEYDEFNREETVLPDGLITLPPKGHLKITGLTRTEIENKVTELFSDILTKPVISVSLIRYNYAANQLKNAIISDNQGQARHVVVSPDGYLSFPAIKSIQITGMTLDEINSEINQAYQKKYSKILQVFLSLTEAKNNIVYVMGEVRSPNIYQINNFTTLSMVLARAGISFETAEISSIGVLSRDSQNQPTAQIIDLGETIRTGNIGKDIALHQYDVVFVPKTRIRELSQFVNQLNDLIPYFNGLSVNYNLNRIDM